MTRSLMTSLMQIHLGQLQEEAEEEEVEVVEELEDIGVTEVDMKEEVATKAEEAMKAEGATKEEDTNMREVIGAKEATEVITNRATEEEALTMGNTSRSSQKNNLFQITTRKRILPGIETKRTMDTSRVLSLPEEVARSSLQIDSELSAAKLLGSKETYPSSNSLNNSHNI